RGQRTIGRIVEYHGRGLFHGQEVSIRLRPQPPNTGIQFQRVDLPGSPTIPAGVAYVKDHKRRILLAREGAAVEGIEHIMAAVSGLGIDNVLVEITGKEMPAGDGSSLVFVQLIREAGVVEHKEAPRQIFTLYRTITLENDGARITAVPYDKGLELSYHMDFGDRSVLRQSYTLPLNEETFSQQISSARTFSLSSGVGEFIKLGLGKGVTEENCFLINEDGTASTPINKKRASLRFADEGVRHKLLDMVGDLYLTGMELRARVTGTRSGHLLNVLLAKKIVELAEAESSLSRIADAKV
ncbi:MAG: UDP-3-O-[3-hydroxymyristoyl] N-acetylglucosamine deacetylase, partial [Planctomycetes bacterium RIFCSPHIGHO2_12_FULL_51_37]